MRFVEEELAGWGRYPRSRARVYRPEKLAQLSSILKTETGPCLARGMGRSYGDAALNGGGGLLLTQRLNRFLRFDPQSGRLACESGVRFDEILEVCLPQGWFLPVTPGTKHVSVGGAVACDVHGKNHHVHGSLGRHLRWLEVELADGSRVRCSQQQDSELFWATIGGLGLTGVIISAGMQLVPVETAYLQVETFRSGNLEETMALLEEEDDQFTYSVAWVDCLAGGRKLGRSVLIRGNHATVSDLPVRHRDSPLRVEHRELGTVPFELPGFLLNPLTIRCMNGFYYRKFPQGRARTIQHYDPFFYPLDVIRNWNLAYGRQGFVQYQCCFPEESSQKAMKVVLEKIVASGLGSFLAVLKRFGPQEGMLSFPIPGFTLALDFPMKGGRLLSLLQELDSLVIQWGGRVYLAKDARLARKDFEQMYSDLGNWRRVRRQVDPEGRFVSDLARRLGLDVT